MTWSTHLQWMVRNGQIEQNELRIALRVALEEHVRNRRAEISCRDCGVKSNGHKNVIWHHPDRDRHLGNYVDLIRTLAPIEEIDAAIDRCVPLCLKCHSDEHVRMDKAADKRAARSTPAARDAHQILENRCARAANAIAVSHEPA